MICWQDNNDVYVDENNQNLIVKLKEFEKPEKQVTVKDKLVTTGSTLGGICMLTGLSIIFPPNLILMVLFWDVVKSTAPIEYEAVIVK